MMKRITLSLVVAATAVMATTSIAQAAWATVRRDSDVYRTASSNRVVNEVEKGDRVNVVDCDDDEDRCLIQIPGRDGWIDVEDLRAYGKSGSGITFNFGGSGGSVGITLGY